MERIKSNVIVRKVKPMRTVDTTIKVSNTFIECNKSVLIAESPFFEAMFAHSFKEKDLVEIQDIDPDIMKSILHFMHAGYLEVRSDNITDIIHACSFLQMNKLNTIVCEILADTYLEIETCIPYFCLAQNYALCQLAETCRNYILRHFSELVSHPDLFRLDESNFINIISDDKLHIPNEDLAFEAALKWAEAGSRDLDKVMPFIRFPYCTPHQHECPPRNSFQKLLVIKSDNSKGLNTLFFTDLFQSPWQELSTFPYKIVDYSACSTSNAIIITGGAYPSNDQHPLKISYRFDIKLKQWKKLPPMPRPRSQHLSIFHDNAVYVLAGKNRTRAVDKFQNGKWTEVHPHRVVGLETACAVSMNENIFVFSPLDKIQMYNSQTDQWIFRKDSPCLNGILGLAATVNNNKIYLFGGFCMKQPAWSYDPDTDQWVTLADPHRKHAFFSAISFDGKILLGAGIRTNRIEQYDIENNQWSDWRLAIPECPPGFTKNERHFFCTTPF